MMKDLGRTPSEAYGEPVEMPKDKKFYPSVHFSGPENMDLPKRGKMTVEFEVVSRSESTNKEGETRYECSVELRKLLDVEGEDDMEAPAKSGSEASEALDVIRKQLEAHHKMMDGSHEDNTHEDKY